MAHIDELPMSNDILKSIENFLNNPDFNPKNQSRYFYSDAKSYYQALSQIYKVLKNHDESFIKVWENEKNIARAEDAPVSDDDLENAINELRNEIIEMLDSYVVKEDAPGFDDILTKTEAETIYATLDSINSLSERMDTAEEDINHHDEDITEINQTLSRALLTPVTRPQEKIIIGVDETNSEVICKLGEGLTIEGITSPFTIKASASSSVKSKIVYTNMEWIYDPSYSFGPQTITLNMSGISLSNILYFKFSFVTDIDDIPLYCVVLKSLTNKRPETMTGNNSVLIADYYKGGNDLIRCFRGVDYDDSNKTLFINNCYTTNLTVFELNNTKMIPTSIHVIYTE